MKLTTSPDNINRKERNAYGLRNEVAEHTALALHNWHEELNDMREAKRIELQELRDAWQAKVAAWCAAQNTIELNQERIGKGVAWVHGADAAPDYLDGDGMTEHRCAAPVITKAKPRVVCINRKLTVYWV